MADKKIIERNLHFNQKYIYLSTKKGNMIDGDCTTCDNCGKLISNICNVVRQSDKKHFYIGTDCAQTLAKAKCLFNNGQSTDFQTDMYSLSLVNRFVTQYNKTPELADFNGMQWQIIISEMINGKVKVKQVQCFNSDLEIYAPSTFKRINQLYPIN